MTDLQFATVRLTTGPQIHYAEHGDREVSATRSGRVAVTASTSSPLTSSRFSTPSLSSEPPSWATHLVASSPDASRSPTRSESVAWS